MGPQDIDLSQIRGVGMDFATYASEVFTTSYDNYQSLFILDENDLPLEERDHSRWNRWMDRNQSRCHVGHSMVESKEIITRFVGKSTGKDCSKLYATSIVDGHTVEMYATRKEAEEGHNRHVKKIIEL